LPRIKLFGIGKGASATEIFLLDGLPFEVLLGVFFFGWEDERGVHAAEYFSERLSEFIHSQLYYKHHKKHRHY